MNNQIMEARNSVKKLNSMRDVVVAMANTACADDKIALESLLQVGENCRQIGAHEAAARVFSKICEHFPQHSHASKLRDILCERKMRGKDIEEGPIPFVHVRDFLSSELRDLLLQMVIADREKFGDATTFNSDAEMVVSAGDRLGRVLRFDLINPYMKLFLPELLRALREIPILSRLGDLEISHKRIELQVTNYSDGDFFAKHVDDDIGPHRDRRVSFVYYLRRTPDSFYGGDLLLHDREKTSSSGSSRSFTRILPLDNSIVFFPSSCLHEVLPTFVESGRHEDGRISVNGWLLSKSQPD